MHALTFYTRAFEMNALRLVKYKFVADDFSNCEQVFVVHLKLCFDLITNLYTLNNI